MSTPRPLHLVPDAAEQPSDAEDRAHAEVARGRADLPPLDETAFDCFLGGLVRGVAEHTEADPVAVLASLISAAGVHLGQSPHVRAGDDQHPLLVWPLIIGRTNSGRKGSSWGTAKRLLRAADPEFAETNLKSGLTSGEGLANMFTETDDPPAKADDPPPASTRKGGLPLGDRRLLVFEPEWAGVMARMRREGNALSATLRAAWEGGDLSTLAVTARIAPSSHIGLLAHITPDEFRAKVSASDMAGGTYNRFLPISVARTQFLPLSTGANPELIAEFGAALTRRLHEGAELSTLGFTAAGAATWRELYVEFGTDQGDTGAVEQFISRAAPNCLRIAAIHAALDGHDRIDAEHLRAAAALVRYSIASARTVFGSDPTTARLVAWIGEAGEQGRTKTDITGGFFKGKPPAELAALLDQLTDAGQLARTERTSASGKGRKTTVYISAPPEVSN
jgi:hypothetical protein